jgi:hypothetical protein
LILTGYKKRSAWLTAQGERTSLRESNNDDDDDDDDDTVTLKLLIRNEPDPISKF